MRPAAGAELGPHSPTCFCANIGFANRLNFDNLNTRNLRKTLRTLHSVFRNCTKFPIAREMPVNHCHNQISWTEVTTGTSSSSLRSPHELRFMPQGALKNPQCAPCHTQPLEAVRLSDSRHKCAQSPLGTPLLAPVVRSSGLNENPRSWKSRVTDVTYPRDNCSSVVVRALLLIKTTTTPAATGSCGCARSACHVSV